MDDGWDDSAQAWIAAVGTEGDWGRQHVLDPVMIAQATTGTPHNNPQTALDVGCGEGRFCRLLQEQGIATVGIDPTRALLEEAKRRDPAGDYRYGRAEALDFEAASFDLVVSYLTLIDIADFRTAIREMVRVLRPGGTLLVANLNGFITAGAETSWITDDDGTYLHYPVDRYQEEIPVWVAWDGIRIVNWHRPLSAYMETFLACGLELSFFTEPEPVSGEPARQANYRRAPWFLVMTWRKPTKPKAPEA